MLLIKEIIKRQLSNTYIGVFRFYKSVIYLLYKTETCVEILLNGILMLTCSQ